jgi:hypothetical protein
MKKLSWNCVWLLLGAVSVQAQNPVEDLIRQGRAYLAATNFPAANVSFSNAVYLAPAHQTGNVLYAYTRVTTLPMQAVGSNFLNRLGFPAVGRDLFQWTALPAADTNGVLLAPTAGVNANELAFMLRTNVVPELIAAEANLARVTSTNFLLSLNSSETRLSDVALDYGDMLMLRSMLNGIVCWSYTVYSWNLDAQFSAVRSLYDNGLLSVERVFRNYPALWTFATTNDLNAAKSAFRNGVDRYIEASQSIRSRDTNIVRLFNFDPDEARSEEKFRLTLIDLKSSLNAPVTLRTDPRYTVSLASQFNGRSAPRSFLPALRGNGFGLETFPDPTFGGVIQGVDMRTLDAGLARLLIPIPTLEPDFSLSGAQIQFPINTLRGRGYVVEVSTNLVDWSRCAAFFSFEDGLLFTDPSPATPWRRFYRAVDRTDSMPAPPNDDFADRIPLLGSGATAEGYNAGATAEPGERGIPWNSVWWSWAATVSGEVEVSTAGSTAYPMVTVFTGSILTNLDQTSLSYGNRFYAEAGTTYQIQVSGDPGGIRLAITAPPQLVVFSPRNGTVSLVPTNVLISAAAFDPDGTIARLEFQTDGDLLAATTNSSLSVTWSNVGIGEHWIWIEATDDLGATTSSNLNVTVPPPNDKFANRISLTGTTALVAGINSGASKEPGEPNHVGDFGGRSVWWCWTAPAGGYITIGADLVTPWGSHSPLLAVYTGTSVSNLTLIAGSASIHNGPAQVSFSVNAGTTYQIAVDGQSGFSGNISLRLAPTQAPIITITSPTNSAVFYGAPSIPIVVSASDPDGTVARVDFYDHSSLIGSRTNAPFTFTWTNPPFGMLTLSARATDNLGAVSWSDDVFITMLHPETYLPLGGSLPNLAGAQGSEAFYLLTIPLNASYLEISISGGSGDCDLYIAYGYQPELYDWDYRPYMHGNYEVVRMYDPQPGDWHVMLRGWNAYSGVWLSTYYY